MTKRPTDGRNVRDTRSIKSYLLELQIPPKDGQDTFNTFANKRVLPITHSQTKNDKF